MSAPTDIYKAPHSSKIPSYASGSTRCSILWTLRPIPCTGHGIIVKRLGPSYLMTQISYASEICYHLKPFGSTKPGSEKTYLMSMVLKHIREHHGAGIGLAYFFYDNKSESPEKRALLSIVKTLVSQLLAIFQNPAQALSTYASSNSRNSRAETK